MTTPLQFLAGARALQGEGQALPVQLSGSIPTQEEDTQTQDDAVAGVHTFAGPIDLIEIANLDPVSTLTAVVNGVTIKVPRNTAFGPRRVTGTPSAQVTVSGSTAYLINSVVYS